MDVDGQRCCVRYDNGVDEWMLLQQQHFRWLGPRAATAGCCAAMKVRPALHLCCEHSQQLQWQHRIGLMQFSCWGCSRATVHFLSPSVFRC